MDTVKIDDVLRLQDFGLERLDEDQAILRFAQRAEARIARWLDFAKGALLMLMVADDPVMRHDLLPRHSHDLFQRVSQNRVTGVASPLVRTPARWDRILACIGTTGIPVSKRRKEERPAKAPGDLRVLIAQGLRSEASPKKWGV